MPVKLLSPPPSGMLSIPHYARGQHKAVLKEQTGLFSNITASPLLQCES